MPWEYFEPLPESRRKPWEGSGVMRSGLYIGSATPVEVWESQWRRGRCRERPVRGFTIPLVKSHGSEPADGVGIRRGDQMLGIPPSIVGITGLNGWFDLGVKKITKSGQPPV